MSRRALSAEEKAQHWRLVEQRQRRQEVGRELGRHPSVVSASAYAHACGGPVRRSSWWAWWSGTGVRRAGVLRPS